MFQVITGIFSLCVNDGVRAGGSRQDALVPFVMAGVFKLRASATKTGTEETPACKFPTFNSESRPMNTLGIYDSEAEHCNVKYG